MPPQQTSRARSPPTTVNSRMRLTLWCPPEMSGQQILSVAPAVIHHDTTQSALHGAVHPPDLTAWK
jgi:hypothetical protein